MNPETINSHRFSFAYRFSQILLGLILCATVVSGCQTPPPPETAPVEGTTYEIAPVFREFHTALGGEAVLGPAISQLFPYQELECQYTLNALMCQNPLLSGSERFMLYPLGKAFDLKPSEAEKNKDSSARVVNGITIYEDFVPLFDKLSGEQYAGNPITGANINYKQKRIEQYFESVGIYRMMDDSAGEARLLAYGAYACDQKCSYPAHAEAMLYDPAETILEQPFKARLDELGIGSAFGVPLTQPYITEDGALEQVYSNVVIYRPAGETDKIRLLPITAQLGIETEKPVPQSHKKDKTIVFYAIKNGKGHHVPARVDKFITNHGGRKLSGNPISEPAEIEAGTFKQCFTNYCVLYKPGAEKGQQVQLLALGLQYLEMIQSSIAQVNPSEISNETISIILSEKFEQLPVKEKKRIHIQLLMKEDQRPLGGIESTLEIGLPDGTQYTTKIAATDVEGRAKVEVPVLKGVRNGDLLVYSVCLITGADVPVCAEGSYLVWNAP